MPVWVFVRGVVWGGWWGVRAVGLLKGVGIYWVVFYGRCWIKSGRLRGRFYLSNAGGDVGGKCYAVGPEFGSWRFGGGA